MGEKGTFGEYWIQHYQMIAPGGSMHGFEHDPADPDNAINPKTGQAAHWDHEKQQWIDQTGKPISPSGLTPMK